MKKNGMKWLVFSSVKGRVLDVNSDSCFSFDAKTAHNLAKEKMKSIDLLVTANFEYESAYNENTLDFLQYDERFYRLVQNVVKHCENRRQGLVKKNLSEVNDDIMDCVGDTYVKSIEQFSATFKTGGVPCYHDFIYLLSRTAYQLYDAYAYKMRRSLRNPSIDDIHSFEDGHIVNSWTTFMKESSDNYANFVTECKNVTDYVGGYQLSENLYTRLCENLDEKGVQIVNNYADALAKKMDFGTSIPENVSEEFERIVTRVKRAIGKTERELRNERNEKIYAERLLRQSQRELKRLETKRLASEKALERKCKKEAV
jgi:hypothetical protein